MSTTTAITDIRDGRLFHGSDMYRILPEAPASFLRFNGYLVTDGVRDVYCTATITKYGSGVYVAWLASAHIQSHYMDCMYRAKGFEGRVYAPIENNEMEIHFPSLYYATRFVRAYGGPQDFQLRTDVSGWGKLNSPVTIAYSPF